MGTREWLLTDMGLLFGVMKMFWNSQSWSHSLVNILNTHHQVGHFKRVNFMICELDLNS